MIRVRSWRKNDPEVTLIRQCLWSLARKSSETVLLSTAMSDMETCDPRVKETLKNEYVHPASFKRVTGDDKRY